MADAIAKFWVMPRTGTALSPVDSTSAGVTATKGFNLAADLIGGLPRLRVQTDRRRIVPGRNTLCSNASRPPSETLPLRGSAVQDARHVAISASDDGGAYRRPGEGAEVTPWGATRAEETATILRYLQNS